MDALQCYDSSSGSDTDDVNKEGDLRRKRLKPAPTASGKVLPSSSVLLPPPPLEFFSPLPNPLSESKGIDEHGGRVRRFAHVDGNFALHIYIPVTLSSPIQSKLAPYLQKAASMFPSLKSMEDDDLSTRVKSKQAIKLASEFHISLGHTVPIRIHQVDTIVPMLRRKFESQKRFWVEFGSWEVFINDDRTRSFLSLEIVAAGTPEIQKQVSFVDDVYKLHNLPTFYKNPRPHISLAYALGDVVEALAVVSTELNIMAHSQEEKRSVAGDRVILWSSQASKVECKVGQKIFPIWTANL